MKQILAGTLIIIAGLFLLSASSVMAQLPCTADFDCDQDVDATDVSEFLNQFGRSPFNNPCPDCYDSPCPCPAECPLSTCEMFEPEICQAVGGSANCCCCVPRGNPTQSGLCTDLETCITLPPHPIYGQYECFPPVQPGGQHNH